MSRLSFYDIGKHTKAKKRERRTCWTAAVALAALLAIVPGQQPVTAGNVTLRKFRLYWIPIVVIIITSEVDIVDPTAEKVEVSCSCDEPPAM